MFFSRCLLVVYKTTGGKAWNPTGELRPLSPSQIRTRKKNLGIVMKNLSVLKMAAARQPTVPVRLYKPLNFTRMVWLRKKLEEARQTLVGSGEDRALQSKVRSLLPCLRASDQPGSLLPPAARAALIQDGTQQH
ncbi:hypothetical protein PLESTB_000028100 [Pleodorina starrii]|uniref:Uncharacterized protein n=1 Tax=Pleodorina starrii TaxID=330485 RepID=A0A9W6B8Y3_9CHLO|nr:hypothetical protein PLESTM_001106500 [Pleodorina starrii]GLC47809.1 hypothetical protein PLESTB_000028100 [Pleodorina starrii]GLC70768.1 hypothetical protein PLESTF_001031200 [Pleodorina starrii]